MDDFYFPGNRDASDSQGAPVRNSTGEKKLAAALPALLARADARKLRAEKHNASILAQRAAKAKLLE